MTTSTVKGNSTNSNRLIKDKRVIQQLTNKDALLDAFISLYHATSKCQKKSFSDSRNKFLQLYGPVYHDINRSKLSLQKDFQLLHKDTFVEGAFGKVTIVKSNHDNTIYALKTLNKSYLIDQMDRSSPMEERLILSNENEEWLPKLHCSFQDAKNLYLVMEYAHGGDLENLMERRQNAAFSEQEAKFYIAELILAVERIHQLGYIHRDIKPANILIDQLGHIKLGDLGSCISIETKDPLLMVGTMPYISPEMCNSEGHDFIKGPAYGTEVDWWSVGIVLYELIHGQTPFTGKDIQIQMSLVNPKISVNFPSSPSISKDAKDLISKLLLKDKKSRLVNVQQIKGHPFFQDIDWATHHTKAMPPFIPSIKSQDDITFFASTPLNNQDEEEEDSNDKKELDEEENDADISDRESSFIGYTYVCSSLAQKKSPTTASVTRTTISDTQAFLAQCRQNRLTRSVSSDDNTDKMQLEIKRLKSLLENKEKLSIMPPAESAEALETLKKVHNEEVDRLKTLLEKRDTAIANLNSEIEQQKKFYKAEIDRMIKMHDSANSAFSDAKTKQMEQLGSRIMVLESNNKELVSRNQMLDLENKELVIHNKLLASDKEELQSNNAELESDIKKLTVINQELQVSIVALENDERELQVKINQLSNNNQDHELRVVYLERKNEQLVMDISILTNDKKERESAIAILSNNNTSASKALEHRLLDQQQAIALLKKEIDEYRSNKSLLEEHCIPSLEKEKSELNTKLLQLENQILTLTDKLQAQSTDYNLLLQQSKSECAKLNMELAKLQRRSSTSNSQMKQSNKSLPTIPTTTSLPHIGPDYSPGEGRSLILSSMWQRDRESLRSVQQALEESESNLAFAKRQVVRLKKEVKCFQKYTFEQQQQHQDGDEVEGGFIGKNMMDNGNRVPPITPPQKPISSPSIEDIEVALLDKKLGYKKKGDKAAPQQQPMDAAILEEIEREQNFINCTKRTIAARSRLSRTKGEIDQELEKSLGLASKRLGLLESKVCNNNKRTSAIYPLSSPKDFLSKKKKDTVV